MESFFSYKNRKTNLNLFFDVRSIDCISLMEIETNTRDCENYIQLRLTIHFKNTNYHQDIFFDKDDEEGYIIYNSLIETINKKSPLV